MIDIQIGTPSTSDPIDQILDGFSARDKSSIREGAKQCFEYYRNTLNHIPIPQLSRRKTIDMEVTICGIADTDDEGINRIKSYLYQYMEREIVNCLDCWRIIEHPDYRFVITIDNGVAAEIENDSDPK